ncbi:MAG: protein kinase [Myxococcales bacterium]|nr:protein kinase [Myxococcales bacterium]
MTRAEEQLDEVLSMVGTVLAGRYRLDALIGEGGMGAVFRGHHILLKRDVAIKILHPEIKGGSELSRRFDREAQSAARLEHVNCIHVTEYGSTDAGMKYMVMPLLDGRELQDKYRTALPPGRAVELVLQVIRGLEHAHGRGVIHRDLKPQNIFVTTGPDGDDVLKIVDFGIAKMVNEEDVRDDTKTKAGLVFGTPLYMSPEQALGLEVDARADLYSVGVILYEMLAGTVPFRNNDPVALIRMQVSSDPPALPERVPSELAAIVYRLMMKDRDDRFPDATTVRKVLEGFLASYRQRVGDDDDFILDDEPIPGISAAPTVAPGALHRADIHRASTDALNPRPPTAFDTVVYHSGRPWMWFFIIVLLLGGGAAGYWFYGRQYYPPEKLLALFGLKPAGDDAGDETGGDGSEPSDTGPGPGGGTAGPTSEELSELDREIVARAYDEALTLLKPLRERYPENTDLLWREARLLSQRKGQKSEALALYAEAMRIDPGMATNLGFFAELDKLLRYRALRDQAIEVTLEHLGERGHDLLVTFINDDKKIPPYELRHRVIDALNADAELAAKIEVRANLVRDFDQYAESMTPCASFVKLMLDLRTRVDEELVDEDFKQRLNAEALVLPKLTEGAPPEEVSACTEVPGALDATRAALLEKFPDKTKTKTKKTKKKKSTKSKKKKKR